MGRLFPLLELQQGYIGLDWKDNLACRGYLAYRRKTRFAQVVRD